MKIHHFSKIIRDEHHFDVNTKHRSIIQFTFLNRIRSQNKNLKTVANSNTRILPASLHCQFYELIFFVWMCACATHLRAAATAL